MSSGLSDVVVNMSDLDEDFEVLEQDDHINGEENDYDNSDSEADNDDAVDEPPVCVCVCKNTILKLRFSPALIFISRNRPMATPGNPRSDKPL
ncbi:hypothetical protein FQA39_LY02415 [Lamprigera yunnana]|nr:hypothetical protein FQA39_LY02415 [Lamprigera yunnana]